MESVHTILRATGQIFIAALVVALFTVIAGAQFSEPASAPPAGNVSPPINEGSIDQAKVGGFGVGGNFTVGISDDNINRYSKIDAENIFGAPSLTDCSQSAHLGRMIYTHNSHNLYICGTGSGGFGCTQGSFCWRWVTTTDL